MSGQPIAGIHLGTIRPITILGTTAGMIPGITTAGTGIAIPGTTVITLMDGGTTDTDITEAITATTIPVTTVAAGQATVHAVWSLPAQRDTLSIVAMWDIAGMVAPAAAPLAARYRAPRRRVAVSVTATPVLLLHAPAATVVRVAAQARRWAPVAVRAAATAVVVPVSVVPVVAVEAADSADRAGAAVAVREAVDNSAVCV